MKFTLNILPLLFFTCLPTWNITHAICVIIDPEVLVRFAKFKFKTDFYMGIQEKNITKILI